MLTCILFGDDEINESIRLRLRQTMTDLIENHNVDLFYVGDEGSFNLMAIEELRTLEKLYPHIYFEIVVCNIPYKEYNPADILMKNLMVIGGEKGETREHGLRVIRDWMVYASDCVIIYERKLNAELRRLRESATKQKKTIIEI